MKVLKFLSLFWIEESHEFKFVKIQFQWEFVFKCLSKKEIEKKNK